MRCNKTSVAVEEFSIPTWTSFLTPGDHLRFSQRDGFHAGTEFLLSGRCQASDCAEEHDEIGHCNILLSFIGMIHIYYISATSHPRRDCCCWLFLISNFRDCDEGRARGVSLFIRFSSRRFSRPMRRLTCWDCGIEGKNSDDSLSH